MNLLDSLTLISYIALNIDLVLQIRRIYKTKSSDDISLTGIASRYVAIIIILIKFISLESVPLVVGQGLVAVTFTVYFIMAVTYFINRKNT